MGTCYKSPAIVVVCFQSDVPVFGQIMEIIAIGDNFFLVLQLLKAVVYNGHFHAYEVVPTSVLQACQLSRFYRESHGFSANLKFSRPSV